jgi:Tetratricopeptide Repeats-Sensor
MATIFDDVTMHRNTAQSYRSEAKRRIEAKSPQEAESFFESAVAEQQKAIRILRRELNSIGEEREKKQEKLKLLRLLSQTYGSIGGIWRDAAHLEQPSNDEKTNDEKRTELFKKAIDAYDQGYEIEKERKQFFNDDDSYNLLQRIVVRILHKPPSLDDSDQTVEGKLTVRQALELAHEEIKRQVVNEKTRTDSWAKADLVLVRALLQEPAEKALKDLEMENPDFSFYASTLTVIKALIEEGLGKDQELGNRLQEFQLFLERKGGISQ